MKNDLTKLGEINDKLRAMLEEIQNLREAGRFLDILKIINEAEKLQKEGATLVRKINERTGRSQTR
jgi:hypothetical protein